MVENSSDFVNYLIRENDFQFPRELRLKEKERETVQGQETAIAKSSIKIDKTFLKFLLLLKSMETVL